MPSKVKANVIATGSAGFLKPTFSSRSKAVDKTETRPTSFWTKEQNDTKTQVLPKKSETKNSSLIIGNPPICLPSVVQESPLRSSASKSKHLNTSNSSIRSSAASSDHVKDEPVTKNEPNLPSPATSPTKVPEADLENDIKIRDARKACDELRQQIEDLKKQQSAFQSRLSGDFDLLNLNDPVSQTGVTANAEKNQELECVKCPPLVGKPENIEYVEAVAQLLTETTRNCPEISKNDELNYTLTEDGFNLHGSVTSSDVTDFTVRDEWLGSRGLPKDLPSSKVIKRLLSERERYKKKVKHLQLALHRLKRQKMKAVARTPDIAAHDIVYFNADLIGEGYLSYVYSGTIFKNQKAAIKKLIRPDMMSTSDRSYLAAEAGLLMALHHQNIVEVFGVSTAPLQPLIITGLVKGKSLHDRLHTADGWPLSPVEYYSTVRDVTVGMAYLHGQKPPVLHLNLRPCNVLLDTNGRAKVSDFGFSKIRLDAGISNQKNLVYLAPELLCFPVHLTTKLDVYSFAVIMWEMATMTVPYRKWKPSEILDAVSNGKRLNIPCELPSGFHAIISRSWDHSPMQRPSFKELIILLETMTLPHEWEDAIKRSGLNRADTRGLITPRDSTEQNARTKSNDTGVSVSNGAKLQENRPELYQENAKSRMRKLSDELALESDMITHGYILPKPEIYRQESENYLRGFKASPVVPQNQSPSLNRWKNAHSGHHRSLATRLSPYKYNFANHTPVLSPYYPKNSNPDGGFIEDNGLVYKAARNLNQELISHSDGRASPKRRQANVNGTRKSFVPKDQYAPRGNGNAGRRKRGSRSSSETDASLDGKNGDAPIPLNDRQFRYYDQDLTIETPKIVTGRSSRNPNRSRAIEDHQQQQRSPRSAEDLRTAVSIPYLKNLRSGDEISSASGDQTNRSHFDEKLSSYVSQACQAESRNYVDAKMKGWRSDKSAILNKEPTVTMSDYVKVRSIPSTAPDQGFMDGGRRNASSALSESPETVMTTQYHPDEAKRKELHRAGRIPKYDGIISPSSSDKSFDESRRIGVTSIPSTSGTRVLPHRPRHSSGGPRVRHSSDGKWGESHPSGTNQQRFLRRENSWNKLKNSYSPEPLIPHFGTPPRSVNIPLPPALAAPDSKESAFTRLPQNSSKHAVKPKRRNQAAERSESFHAPVPTNGNRLDEMDHGSDSTLSSAANGDDVGDALSDTARELTSVSNILETAAEKHRSSRNDTRKERKTKK